MADVLDWEIRHNYVLVIEAWDNYQFGYTAGESRNAFKQIQYVHEISQRNFSIFVNDKYDFPNVILNYTF